MTTPRTPRRSRARLAPPGLGLLFALAISAAPHVARALPAGDVVVLALTDRDPRTSAAEEGAWLPARLADLVGERLATLGLPTRDRRFVDAGAKLDLVPLGLAAVVSGRVRPETALEPSTPIEIEVELRLASGPTSKKKLRATAGDLDPRAAELALFVADALGLATDASMRALLTEPTYPFAVHRALGLARAHLDADSLRKAMVMYDRASELFKQAPIPEALEGRARAEGVLAARGEATFGARADLAPPAAERAQVAKKQGDEPEARRALEAFLRYTSERALRWSVEVPLVRGTSVVVPRGVRWVVQPGEGPRGRWSIEPRTGAVLAVEPSLRGLIGSVGGHALVLDGRTLLRIDENGRPKWKVELPVRPHGLVSDAVDLTSGLAGIMGEHEVAWVETSFGSLGQRAEGVKPLASGTGGILVLEETSVTDAKAPDTKTADAKTADAKTETAELVAVSLLRPGKKTAAWTAKTKPVLDAAMTQDRVLVVTREGLLLLRAHDGKEAAKPIALLPEPKIIGAEGRYAVIAGGPTGASIIDVLAGEKTADVEGPGRPIGAYTAAVGVAVLYATGDLLFFDRDGHVLDRARAPGEPLELVAGSPMTPGPVVVTTRGLYAYAEVPVDPTHLRDVDALLDLAVILDHQKEPAAALRLATTIARLGVGRVDRAEELRAQLLARRTDPAAAASAARAKARAQAARDATKPLPPFAL